MPITEESNNSTRTNNIYWARRIGRESFKEKDILFNFYVESMGKVWITISRLLYKLYDITVNFYES